MSSDEKDTHPERRPEGKKEPEFIRKVVTLSKRDRLSEERNRSHRKASPAL